MTLRNVLSLGLSFLAVLIFMTPRAVYAQDRTPDDESLDDREPPPVPLDVAGMRDVMHAWFDEEEIGGIVFVSTGASALIAGGVLVAFDDEVLRPASYPLLGIGLVHVIVGSVVLARADEQRAALDAALSADPIGYLDAERARMAAIQRGFIWLHVVETVLAVGGLVTATVGYIEDVPFAQGFGISLGTMSVLSLALDLWAAERASEYIDGLDRFALGLGVAADGAVSLTLGGRF